MNAYRLLFFLTLLNLLNFVDRQLIASFANFIVPDLGLTDTQYGFLTTVPFIVFYSIAGLFMGVLADMVNRPKLIAFGVVLWSIFTAPQEQLRVSYLWRFQECLLVWVSQF